jgi:hypothetical protein
VSHGTHGLFSERILRGDGIGELDCAAHNSIRSVLVVCGARRHLRAVPSARHCKCKGDDGEPNTPIRAVHTMRQ